MHLFLFPEACIGVDVKVALNLLASVVLDIKLALGLAAKVSAVLGGLTDGGKTTSFLKIT